MTSRWSFRSVKALGEKPRCNGRRVIGNSQDSESHSLVMKRDGVRIVLVRDLDMDEVEK